MFIDGRQIPDQEILNADICIVGAGPAGITVARELNGQDYRVILLESGDFEGRPEVQDLNQGSLTGDPFVGPYYMRKRFFGGTANIWPIRMGDGRIGVRYVPLDPLDFEKRDWVPYSGWPISRADLDPYYERAHKVAQTGAYNYDPEYWQTEDAQPLPFQGDRVGTQMFHFGPRDVFTHEYRQDLIESDNIQLITFANALEVTTDELAQVATGVKVGTLSGNQFSVQAKVVIVAVGGLEAARLLLLSDSVQKVGLGNGNDLVGRFFMDHPIVRPGVLTPKDRNAMNRLNLYDARWVKGARVLAKPVLTEEVMRREGLLNTATAIFPRPGWMGMNPLRRVFPKGLRPDSPAVASAKHLKKIIRDRKPSMQVFSDLWKMVTGVDDLIYFEWRKQKNRFRHRPLCGYDFNNAGWHELENKPELFGCLDLLHITEQAPDPDNRVTLTGERDAFGYRRLNLHWRWTEINQRSARKVMDIFAEEFAKVGLGTTQFELDHGIPQIWLPSMHHNMGTTRMHESPKQGVVDANCQVHGVSNLFIASSSVFPTGGYANSTLTILALALRISDHVKASIK
jgi:choline dehydrogenase-like flavoprotein